MHPKYICSIVLALLSYTVAAKKKKKPKVQLDKIRIEYLKQDIQFLAADSLEGRRTGSQGETIASAYIQERFKAMGIQPYQNDYIIPFEVKEKYQPTEKANFSINGTELIFKDDYAPLTFSAYTEFTSLVIPNMIEAENMWMVSATTITKDKIDNPHETAYEKYFEYAAKAIKEKCTGLIIYNNTDSTYDYNFKMTHKDTSLSIPIVFVNYAATKKYIIPSLKRDWIDYTGTIDLVQSIRKGKNVVAYINNNAAQTVIIGAHYDHLGYGEDHNSMYTGKEKAIHNGADDNASGTAALLALAEMIKGNTLHDKNYLFTAFSGEELGLYGSKKFADEFILDSTQYAYMINIDMIGRLNDSTKGLTIGGVGTSSIWTSTLESLNTGFNLKYDSSGVGPSDHTSFYMKNLPVLFYFTGLHTDYHKPSDDADKVNYTGENEIVKYIFSLVKEMDSKPKPDFIKTKEQTIKSTAFKVTLGIMPDYTFSGNGVRVDGISENRPAQKAGLSAGDIIQKLGDYKISDMQTYMEALSKFKKGDNTSVIVQRKEEQKSFPILFE